MMLVSRMQCSAPRSRRGALLIRDPLSLDESSVGPGSAVHREGTLHRVRDTPDISPQSTAMKCYFANVARAS